MTLAHYLIDGIAWTLAILGLVVAWQNDKREQP
jgi:hypothetical protein